MYEAIRMIHNPREQAFGVQLQTQTCEVKQIPHQWHEKCDYYRLSNGYIWSQANDCLYTKNDKGGSSIKLVQHSDDMLIVGKHDKTLQELKDKIKCAFSTKDLGHAHHIIGMRIREKRQKKPLFLPQEKCIEK